ncbi:MAG TPA: serine hydrolase domain-containing protein [Thermoanaerobaculia bacterium]|jgi:CubicO group peptidase (beta-lactamase class C family)
MKKLLIGVLAAAVIAGGAYWWTHRSRPIVFKPKDQVVAEIDGDLRQRVANGFAGTVVLSDKGAVILDKGYGLADRAAGRPVLVTTGFDIGSLVKPFTTIAVLRLESRGTLKRSDSIARYLPNVPPDKTGITIQQLLTHSSGLPDIVDASSKPVDYTPDFDYEPVTREEIVRRAMAAKLEFAPGTKEVYSNLGFSLLGAIIETASGLPYEEVVEQLIFRPAGMTRTGYRIPRWSKGELAVGYRDDAAWGTPLDHRWLADGPSWNLRANGGMISTAEDLHRFLAALDRGTLLSPREREAFAELAVRRNARGARTFGAAGSNGIFDGCYLWYVDEHRSLVMLTSSDRVRAETIVPELARSMRSIR